MRFPTLAQCVQYAVQYATESGFNVVGEINVDPMSYNSQQRLTGEHSVEVYRKDGKGTKARLQIVFERFGCGNYECVAYVA